MAPSANSDELVVPFSMDNLDDLGVDICVPLYEAITTILDFKQYKKQANSILLNLEQAVFGIRKIIAASKKADEEAENMRQNVQMHNEKLLSDSGLLSLLAEKTESMIHQKLEKLSGIYEKSIKRASPNSALPKHCVWPQSSSQSAGFTARANVPATDVVPCKPNRAIEIIPTEASNFADSQQTLCYLKSKLTPKVLADNGVSIKKKRLHNNKRVTIFCETEKEMSAVKHLLQDSNDNVVLREVTRHPQLHVAGVPSDIVKEDLVDVLVGSNPSFKEFLNHNPNESLKLKFMSRPVGARKYATVEASPKAFQFVLNNLRGRLCVHFDVCKVTEHHQTIQCHKCLQFGHIAAKCRSVDTVCFHCGGNHKFAQCPAQVSVPKCSNCVVHNTKHNSSLDTGHKATDYVRCPLFVGRINAIKDTINYGG